MRTFGFSRTVDRTCEGPVQSLHVPPDDGSPLPNYIYLLPVDRPTDRHRMRGSSHASTQGNEKEEKKKGQKKGGNDSLPSVGRACTEIIKIR